MTRLTYTSRVLPLFTTSLFVAAIGAFIGYQYLGFLINFMFIIYIVEIVLLLAAMAAHRSRDVGGALLFAFVFVTGLTISPVITLYVINYGGAIIFQALFLTALVFGGLSYYAYMTGNNFSRLGGFLLTGLIGIIIASFVNIFLRNPFVFIIVDIAAILIFSGYVLYDMGRILNTFGDEDVYSAVLSLYIDFLNLFLYILEFLGLFGKRRD